MMKQLIYHAALVGFIFVLLFSFCDRKKKILVQIGAHEYITVDEFKSEFHSYMENKYRNVLQDTIPAKIFDDFLNQRIDDRLMLMAACEAGYDQDPKILAKEKRFFQEQLLSLFYKKAVMDKVVTEKDIREYWKKSRDTINRKNNSHAKTYEKERDRIQNKLLRERQPLLKEATRKYLDKIMKKNDVIYHDQSIYSICSLIATMETNPSLMEMRRKLKKLPDEMKAQNVLTSEIKNISISDLIEKWSKNMTILRIKNLEDDQNLRKYLIAEVRDTLLIVEAIRKRIDKDPDLLRKVKESRESQLISAFLRDSINKKIEIDLADMRAFYDAHVDSLYTTKEQVKVREIQVKDMNQVDMALERIHDGEDFGKVASEITTRQGYQQRKGLLPAIIRGSFEEIGVEAFEMKKNDISVIQSDDSTFSIIKRIDYRPSEIQEFKRVKSSIQKQLKNDLSENRKREWLKKQRHQRNIYINDIELKKLAASYPERR